MSAPDGEGNSKTHSSFLKFLNFVLHLVSLLSNKVLQTKKNLQKISLQLLTRSRIETFCLRSLHLSLLLVLSFFGLVKVLWFGAGMKEVLTLSMGKKYT
jgi:hypothetical protein